MTTRPTPSRFALAVFAPLLLATPAAAQPSPEVDAALTRVMALREPLERAARGRPVELSVTVRNPGGGSTTSMTTGAPDAWRWASVTKMVTAILVLREVEGGRLSLDDTLAKRLPGWGPPGAGAITLRQLLRHQSRLADPDADARPGETPPAWRPGVVIPAKGEVAAVCAAPMRTAPAGQFRYNNCDYLVLGAVLERATGWSYRALVAALGVEAGAKGMRLAEEGRQPPEGFDASMAADEQAASQGGAGRKVLYTTWMPDRPHVPEPPVELAAYGAAAGIVGPMDALLALDRALLDGWLLKPATRALMFDGDPKLGYAALGVWSFPAALCGPGAPPVRVVERHGAVGAVQVRNILLPDRGRAVVAFVADPDFEFGQIWQGRGMSFDLARAAACDTPPTPK